MDKPIISNDSFAILEYLYNESELPDGASEDCLRQLKSNSLIIHTIIGHKVDPDFPYTLPIYRTEITENGKAYVEATLLERQTTEDQLHSLQRIAKELQQRVKVAETDSETARIEAHKAAVRSWIAIAISVVSIIAPLLLSLLIK